MHYKIDKGLVLSLASNADVYARGEKYYRDGKVLELSGGRDGENSVIVRANVDGVYKRYAVKLVFAPDGSFKRYSCDCDGNTVWRGACKHVVAALLALMEAGRGRGGEAKNTAAAQNITRCFEKQLIQELEEDAEDAAPTGPLATLHPTLVTDGKNGVGMELKVGYQRLYVVKCLKNFIMHVNAGNTVSYGKNLTFRHTPRAFDERSRALIAALSDFFSGLSDMNQLSGRFTYRAVSVNTGERFLMSGRLLDRFFEIYEDETVRIAPGALPQGARGALLTRKPPVGMFKLHFAEGAVTLTGEKARFTTLEGAEFMYFLAGDKLHRMDRRPGQSLKALIDELNGLDAPRLRFEGAEYAKFTSYVLPRLRELGLLDPAAVLPAQACAPAPEARLYFDGLGAGVMCKAVFLYGGAAFNPLEEEDGAPIFRDVYAEAKVIGRLKRLGFEADPRRGLFVLGREELIFDLHAGEMERLRALADCYATDAFNRQALRPVKKAAFGVRLRGDLLTVSLGGFSYSAAELMEAMGSYSLKKSYHRLKSGAFINLEDENVRTYADALSALDVSAKSVAPGEEGEEIQLPVFRAAYVDSVLGEGRAGVDRDAAFQALVEDITGFRETNFTVPETLAGTMRDYQKIGFKWLKTLARYGFSGILADEMGLGKTLQIIAVLLSEKEKSAEKEEGGLPSLVVTPTSLMYNWEREFKKFAPALNVTVLAGTAAKRRELLHGSPGTDAFITTYDMLKRDVASYSGMTFGYVIADEAQAVKNPSTQSALALKRLNSRVRFALTGTPVENALSELWSIFDFIMPGYLHSAGKFAKLYETPIVRDDDGGRAALLQKQIAPFILRRLKTDVLTELPEKVETTLFASMSPEQEKIYAAYLLQARGELNEHLRAETASNKIAILAQLTRLRQICCHPATFMEGYSGGSGKLSMTLETIQSAVESGHRVLLFSQFTSMLAILRGKLAESGVSSFYLDGGTESRLRTNMAEQFNNGEKSVFLVSLRAGGTGLNLTGADVVIHYDQWWNPAVMNQAADRAHRYGQKRAVQVINMVTKDTIEEKIISLQNRKKALVDAVLTQSASFINRMTVEELRELLSDC